MDTIELSTSDDFETGDITIVIRFPKRLLMTRSVKDIVTSVFVTEEERGKAANIHHLGRSNANGRSSTDPSS